MRRGMRTQPKNLCKLHTMALVVAHPDDETLWAGGLLLLNRQWDVQIFSLCRGSDPDRAPRFQKALDVYGATGRLADLDDGPEQRPLDGEAMERAVLDLLGGQPFDRIITHAPGGEYTRHRRHEEAWAAVWALWRKGTIKANGLWAFAYGDDGGQKLPQAVADAHLLVTLPRPVWTEKRRIVTEVYGFSSESWEARTTPKVEGFWCFHNAEEVETWFSREEGDS